MNLNRASWIVVILFLWAIPTAIFLSLFLAVMAPGHSGQLRPLEEATFTRILTAMLPLFIVLGILFGLLMHNISKWGKD